MTAAIVVALFDLLHVADFALLCLLCLCFLFLMALVTLQVTSTATVACTLLTILYCSPVVLSLPSFANVLLTSVVKGAALVARHHSGFLSPRTLAGMCTRVFSDQDRAHTFLSMSFRARCRHSGVCVRGWRAFGADGRYLSFDTLAIFESLFSTDQPRRVIVAFFAIPFRFWVT